MKILNSSRTSDRKGIYIAEIGLNHNGNSETAKEMIALAQKSGADAVKFQIFEPHLMNSIYTSSLLAKGVEETIDLTQIEFFKDFILTEEEIKDCKEYAENVGVVFLASVFDFISLEMLEKMDVPLYKIASSEVTNIKLLKAVGATKKPVILSTGIATDVEIEKAIYTLVENGTNELLLMHCVSNYPVKLADVNLSRIVSLKERFNLDVGYSDHTDGINAPSLAAVLGARVFEKHFTKGIDYECPDKSVSLSPYQFQKMVQVTEDSISMVGTGEISYSESEYNTAKAARRSVFARHTIPVNKIIEEDDLVVLRPGIGISPVEIDTIIGKKAKVEIIKDYLIRKEYID